MASNPPREEGLASKDLGTEAKTANESWHLPIPVLAIALPQQPSKAISRGHQSATTIFPV